MKPRKPLTFEQQMYKVKTAAEKREARLRKRLELMRGKPKKKSVNNLKKELKILTHKIVRMQASSCYTCDAILEYKARQAGHFWTVGGHQATRFDFDNIRVQCNKCNSFNSGNLAEYSTRLLAELGLERFNALALKARTVHKWERSELEQMIAERSVILKELENGRN